MRIARQLVWRNVPVGGMPLHLGKMLKYSQGRWNRRGRYAALYTAESRDGALAEWHKVVVRSGTRRRTAGRELVSIQIDLLDPVLDLMNARVRARVGRALGVTVTPETLTLNGERGFGVCRRIADWSRARGYVAIRAPSASLPGATNIIIYTDVGAARRTAMDDGPDRNAIESAMMDDIGRRREEAYARAGLGRRFRRPI